MLKLDIVSENRVGITQEILAVFGDFGWNLLATEMHPCHTYVCAEVPKREEQKLLAALMTISGVSGAKSISLLPSEHRRQHLDTLLSRLPDPVLDIDKDGKILVANQAAVIALSQENESIDDLYLSSVLNIEKEKLLSPLGCSIEIHASGLAYLLEATPVKSADGVDGAVIVLRSTQRVGKQLSAIQSNVLEGTESILGQSAKIQAVKHQCKRFASLNLPVLIQGETGTGKELFAKSLHYEGARKNEPFLAINCATLSENLLESELFGYASGAFSGAQKSGKPGLFELANKGTVFLDEIGEMSTYLQAKLLRFLQDYRFRRIGGTNEISVDVRIICATHRDLQAMSEQGEFRDDLFYRLNVLSLNLPPLRERKEDIGILVPYFLTQACEQTSAEPKHLSPELLKKIEDSDWPGNVRQLQNSIFRAVALTESSTIEHLDDAFLQAKSKDVVDTGSSRTDVESLEQAMSAYEESILRALYSEYPSTRKLAQRLKVSHAKIARKIAKYQI